jgi:hypothetical protein
MKYIQLNKLFLAATWLVLSLSAMCAILIIVAMKASNWIASPVIFSIYLALIFLLTKDYRRQIEASLNLECTPE